VLGNAVGLGALALAAFEKNCWARFFEATGRDPRAPGETQGFTWDVFPPDVCIAQLDTLKAFWKALEPQRRFALIGSTSDINTLFHLSKKTYKELQQKRSDFPQSCSYSTNWKLSSGYKEPYYAAIKTRMQRYLSPRSADLIYKMIDEEGEYVEFLLLSPLERILSIFDIVARKTAEKLKEALTTQIADDLLKTEDSHHTAKKQTCKGKKKKKQKRKDPAPTPSPPVKHTIDSTALVRDILADIIHSAISQATQRTQAAEEGFQTVQSGRKRTEKQKPSEHAISTNSKTASFPVKVRTTHQMPCPKANAQVVIQWAEPNSDLQPVKFEAEADFPPLAGSTGLVTNENLSIEMARFKAQILNIMIFRRKTMLSFIYKMQEIVSFLFPGSYVNIFGSYATRLALPTSDLDLAVLNTGFTRSEVAAAVNSLAEVLPVNKWAVHVQSITTASVPVVKLTVDPHFFGGELKDYLKVDISFEDQSAGIGGKHVGLMAATWVKEMLSEYPFAQELVLALKQVLYLQGLHSAYLGGLSSYSLVLWVTAYLRTFPCKSSGEALLAILKHYADIDLKSTGVGLHADGKYYYPRPQPVFTLCETMDPVTPGNNTTKGAYRITEVQSLFRKSYEQLQAALSQGSKDALTRLFLELTSS
jgi:predicted nucleotidyltransferase